MNDLKIAGMSEPPHIYGTVAVFIQMLELKVSLYLRNGTALRFQFLDGNNPAY